MARLGQSKRTLWVEKGEIFPPPGDTSLGPGPFAILVHGYNNDRKTASKSYQQAKRRLAAAGVGAHVIDQIWELYWPGYAEGLFPWLYRRWQGRDEATGSTFVWASAVSYWIQVRKAKRLGGTLAVYLREVGRRLGHPVEMIMVAHSLGCRLVLEATTELSRRPERTDPQVSAICLMAAAVQTNMVDDRQSRAARRRGTTLRSPGKAFVLYSPSDAVLHWTFGPGQVTAGEWRRGDPLPEAVGRWGEPTAAWTARDNTMLGHGGYWASYATTPHLARLFGVPLPRPVLDNPLREWELPVSWQLPESRR